MKINWVLLSGIGLLITGAGIYLFVIRKKSVESDRYGNLKLKASGNAGMAGGIQTVAGGQSSAITEPNWDNPFDMSYTTDVQKWIAPKKLVVLKDQFAKQYAKELHGAKGGLLMDDNEEAVINVFSKKIKDKVHVSNVSAAFWRDYKSDMYEYLSSFLSENELEKYVLAPIRNLPNYRIV